MNPTLLRRIGASAAVFGVAALAAGPVASAGQGQGAPTVGPKGVGAVKIGASYTSLHKKGLIGKIRRGCELAPGTRSAALKSPLRGSVDFTRKNPRKVTNITITRGALTARDIGIGSTLDEITAAYPDAKVDHSTEEVFHATFVTVPKSDGGKFQFAVEVDTGKTTAIGVPFIATCE
jgi:hypothetical protein